MERVPATPTAPGSPPRQEPVLAQDGRSCLGGVLLPLHPEVEVVGAPHEGDQQGHVGDVPVVELAFGEADHVRVLEAGEAPLHVGALGTLLRQSTRPRDLCQLAFLTDQLCFPSSGDTMNS